MAYYDYESVINEFRTLLNLPENYRNTEYYRLTFFFLMRRYREITRNERLPVDLAEMVDINLMRESLDEYLYNKICEEFNEGIDGLGKDIVEQTIKNDFPENIDTVFD